MRTSYDSIVFNFQEVKLIINNRIGYNSNQLSSKYFEKFVIFNKYLFKIIQIYLFNIYIC